MGTPVPTVAGGRNLVLGSRLSMEEQEEAGENGGHEASKIQAPASTGSGRLVASVTSSYGCAGVEMAALPSEVVREELIGHKAVEQMSKHAASRSVDVTKSLLLKRKPSARNAPKPPVEKQKKSSALHVQFVRSPLLNRVLVSPTIRHSGAKHLRSPSMIRDGPSSTTLDRSPYSGSFAALINPELHQPMEVPPGFHFQPTNEEQICGSQDGGQLHPALLPLQQFESQLPVCTVPKSRLVKK